MRRRRFLGVLLFGTCAVVGAACGDMSTSSSAPEPSSAPHPSAVADDSPNLPVTLTDSTGAEVTITSIDRIAPVDGDLAEIVFALGLGDHVVATDVSATYPPAAAVLPDIGYQRALNAEPIAAVEPTVVLATDLAQPTETLEQLRSLGIPVVVIAREITLVGPGQKVQAVADALGVPQRGRDLVASMTREIDAAVAAGAAAVEASPASDSRRRVLALYLRGERVQLIFGEGTGPDILLPAVGAIDVAAELGIVGTRQITAEALVVAAPDVLLVTTSGLESVGGPRWAARHPGRVPDPPLLRTAGSSLTRTSSCTAAGRASADSWPSWSPICIPNHDHPTVDQPEEAPHETNDHCPCPHRNVGDDRRLW